MKISLIHASYKSYGVAKQVRDSWINSARDSNLVEHCLAFEQNDIQVRREFAIDEDASRGVTNDALTIFVTTLPTNTASAVANWNAAAKLGSGEILLVIADDLVPTKDWDVEVRTLFSSQNPLKPRLFTISDGKCIHRNSLKPDFPIPRHVLMNRAMYKKYGFIYPTEMSGYGCDEYWLIESMKNGYLFDGRDIQFHHSQGAIFSSDGSLNCGCYGQKVGFSKAGESKARLESEKALEYQQISNFLMSQGLLWNLISSLTWVEEVSEDIFQGYLKIASTSKITPFRILVSAFAHRVKNRGATFKFLVSCTKSFVVFFVNRISQKRSP